jgi:hypothetical protein
LKRPAFTLVRTAALLALLIGGLVPFAGVAVASPGSVTRSQSGLVASDSMTTGNMASWTGGGTATNKNVFEDSQGLHVGVQSPSSGTWVNYYLDSQPANAQLFQAGLTIPYTSVADGVFNPGFYVESSSYTADIGCEAFADWSGYYWTVATTTDNGNTWTTLYQSTASSLPQTQGCSIVTNGNTFLKVYIGGVVVFSSSSMALQMSLPLHVVFQVDASSSTMRLATFANYFSTSGERVTMTNAPPGDTAQIVDAANNVLASSPVASNGTASMPVGKYAMPLNANLKVLDPSGNVVASTSSALQIFGGDSYAVAASTLHSTTTTLTPNPASTTPGGSVVFTATVADASGSGASSPSGSVTWSDGGAGGSFSSASCALSSASSTTSSCSASYTPPSAGATATITGAYAGDSTHSGSSGTSTLTVNKRATGSAVAPNPSSVTSGGSITYTATVSDTGPGTPSAPGGTVSWSDGGAGGSFASGGSCALAAAGASAGSCQMSYTAPASAGPVTITAAYPGDAIHGPSSGTSQLSVGSPQPHPTSTSVSPNPATTTTGGQSTLTVTVSDTSASTSSPTGGVTWSDGGAGGSFSPSTVCTLTSVSSSQSKCVVNYTASSTAGSVTITASYAGDSTHTTSSGTTSLSVGQRFHLSKEATGLVVHDPLNNVTMTQAQLQSTNRYWKYDGSARGENAPYSFSEDTQGFHIGVQALADGKYAGFFAVTPNIAAQVFHAVITGPAQTIPNDVYNTALYVQTWNGSIDYVSCGSMTLSSGTYWGVWSATGNSTMAKTSTQLYEDTTPNQPLTRSCTIVTDGKSFLSVYMDNVNVFQSNTLNLQMPSPFQGFIEVQSSYPGQMLSGTFTDFYASTTTALTVDNLPAGAASVRLVDQSGLVIASSPSSNGIATLDIARFHYPLSASIVVKDSSGNTMVASSVLSLTGGDRYGVVAG